MHRLPSILCLVLSVSFLVAPQGRVHAHVTATEHEHQHVSIHGGHDHGIVVQHHDEHGHDYDAAAPHDHDDSGARVLDLQPDVSQRGSGDFDLLQWMAVAFVLICVFFKRVPLRLKLPPPRIRARPPSPYPHALPLLRGPPRSI